MQVADNKKLEHFLMQILPAYKCVGMKGSTRKNKKKNDKDAQQTGLNALVIHTCRCRYLLKQTCRTNVLASSWLYMYVYIIYIPVAIYQVFFMARLAIQYTYTHVCIYVYINIYLLVSSIRWISSVRLPVLRSPANSSLSSQRNNAKFFTTIDALWHLPFS